MKGELSYGSRRDEGKPQQARELPAPAYGWFTEGFDTLRPQGCQSVARYTGARGRKTQLMNLDKRMECRGLGPVILWFDHDEPRDHRNR
jgi:hypothetical protein